LQLMGTTLAQGNRAASGNGLATGLATRLALRTSWLRAKVVVGHSSMASLGDSECQESRSSSCHIEVSPHKTERHSQAIWKM
jgi:hypothetical protein